MSIFEIKDALNGLRTRAELARSETPGTSLVRHDLAVEYLRQEADNIMFNVEFLEALRAEGVDNWGGYEFALDRVDT